MVSWSLEQAYEAYPRIEREFSQELGRSLDPRGPGQLFDLVAGFGLAEGAAVIDVGCGEGWHAVQLAGRFGLSVTGIDPVPSHIEAARAAAGAAGPVFTLGTAEQIPAADAATDLVWCRDVLVHVPVLPAAYAEFHRVLKPGGRALIYQMFGTPSLEPREAAWLWGTMGVVPANADPARTEGAITASGLRVDECIVVGTEWGEWGAEHRGQVDSKLLHTSRLLRGRETYVARYGQAAYDMMLGDCLWHIYAMIGKLERRIYVLSRPGAR